MGIGTSLGTYHDDMFGLWQSGLNAQALANSSVDKQMVTTPDDLMGNKQIQADPNNVFDDSGSIVDYQDPMSVIQQ